MPKSKVASQTTKIKIKNKARWKLCAQESHWHVQNVNNVTTIRLRIRKLIQNVWKQKNTVNSVNHTHCTKKRNSTRWREVSVCRKKQ